MKLDQNIIKHENEKCENAVSVSWSYFRRVRSCFQVQTTVLYRPNSGAVMLAVPRTADYLVLVKTVANSYGRACIETAYTCVFQDHTGCKVLAQ